MTKVQKVKIDKLVLPLTKPFITNIRSSTSLNSLIYRIELDDGSCGYGESAENPKLTGESLEEMISFSKDVAENILGLDSQYALAMLVGLQSYHAAKYGIETALVDALSQSRNESICQYLGLGKVKTTLQNDTTISIMDDANTINATVSTINKGYTHIKYKVKSGMSELNRILNLEKLLGSNVSIRIDPNQAWSRQETIANIEALQNSGIKVEFIEQPVVADDLMGLREISKHSSIPIVADESVFGIADAAKVIDGKYADLINVKLIKCGGPIEAKRIASFAQERGVGCLFGCTSEVNVALSMAANLSAGLPSVKYIDLDGLDYVTGTPFIGGIQTKQDRIVVPQCAGMGVAIKSFAKCLTPIL